MLVDSSSGNPDSNKTYIKYTYGANKDKGTVYAVVGNSGKHEPENGKMHAVMYKKYAADKGVGSMILEVKGNTLLCTYYKENGELFDRFSIVKRDSTSVILGTKSNSNVTDLKVFPNPFANSINIEFEAKNNQPTTIQLQNIIGQLQIETVWLGNAIVGNNKIEIKNLNQLPNGEYIISVTQQDEIVSEKILKNPKLNFLVFLNK